MSEKTVKVSVELSDDEAYALAQFVKRVHMDTCRLHAQNDREADQISEAFIRLRMSLADAGYAPR